MAEAVAMKEGLDLALRIGCNSVIAESDSSETIEACTGSETWWNESVAIYANIVGQVCNIGSIQFNHIPREANKVTHELAKKCFIDKIQCNWDDDPPSFLLSSFLEDVMVIW